VVGLFASRIVVPSQDTEALCAVAAPPAVRQRVGAAYGIVVCVAVVLGTASLTDADPRWVIWLLLGLVLCIAGIPVRVADVPVLEAATKSETTALLTDPINRVRVDDGPDEADCSVNVESFVAGGAASSSSTTSLSLSKSSSDAADFGVLEAFCTPDFWLLFFCFAVSIGSGITVHDNVGAYARTRAAEQPPGHATARLTATMVSLFSVFNTLGRISFGLASDLTQRVIPRPVLLTACLAMMCGAQALFSFASSGGVMCAGMVVLGAAYGGTFTLVPTISGELFGMRRFATIYSWMGVAPALGGQGLSAGLSSVLYAAHSTAQPEGWCSSRERKCCIGANCFRSTLLITTALCGAGIVSALIVTVRWQRRRRGSM
jgi:hypothetical protein